MKKRICSVLLVLVLTLVVLLPTAQAVGGGKGIRQISKTKYNGCQGVGVATEQRLTDQADGRSRHGGQGRQRLYRVHRSRLWR